MSSEGRSCVSARKMDVWAVRCCGGGEDRPVHAAAAGMQQTSSPSPLCLLLPRRPVQHCSNNSNDNNNERGRGVQRAGEDRKMQDGVVGVVSSGSVVVEASTVAGVRRCAVVCVRRPALLRWPTLQNACAAATLRQRRLGTLRYYLVSHSGGPVRPDRLLLLPLLLVLLNVRLLRAILI